MRSVKFEHYFLKCLCTHLEKEEASNLPLRISGKVVSMHANLELGFLCLGRREPLIPSLEYSISPVLVNALHCVKDLSP